jgi:hypothetical protein
MGAVRGVIVARRRLWMLLALMLAAAALGARAARAQIVTLTPGCGKPNDPFTIGGRGWPEPPPPCEYIFFFDGTEFTPRQPDGLFGPPNQAATVPAGAALGKRPVKIELRISEDQSLQGQATKDFCVVTDTTGMLTAAASGTDGIDITFVPSCKIDCTKIMFIQTINPVATKDDDSMVLGVPSEWGFPAGRDADLGTSPGVNSWMVDRIHGRTQPYYGGDGTGLGNQTMGSSDGCNIVNATMHDRPGRPDAVYPAGFKKVTLNFAVSAFCVAGRDAGKYFGRITWMWMKTKGMDPSVTIGAGDPAGQPTQTDLDAVSTWTTNHMFMLPMPTP